jgi:hypothetical protein
MSSLKAWLPSRPKLKTSSRSTTQPRHQMLIVVLSAEVIGAVDPFLLVEEARIVAEAASVMQVGLP